MEIKERRDAALDRDDHVGREVCDTDTELGKLALREFGARTAVRTKLEEALLAMQREAERESELLTSEEHALAERKAALLGERRRLQGGAG
jgi:hypothetical protein